MDRLEKRVVMEATHFLQKDNAQSNERSLEETFVQENGYATTLLKVMDLKNT